MFTDAHCLAIKNASVILPEIIFSHIGNNQLCTTLGLQISTNFETDTEAKIPSTMMPVDNSS